MYKRQVRNVGIAGGRIQAVSAAPLEGRTVIDAADLVVAPGFIDLHSHGQDAENYHAKAMDCLLYTSSAYSTTK